MFIAAMSSLRPVIPPLMALNDMDCKVAALTPGILAMAWYLPTVRGITSARPGSAAYPAPATPKASCTPPIVAAPFGE